MEDYTAAEFLEALKKRTRQEQSPSLGWAMNLGTAQVKQTHK